MSYYIIDLTRRAKNEFLFFTEEYSYTDNNNYSYCFSPYINKALEFKELKAAKSWLSLVNKKAKLGDLFGIVSTKSFPHVAR